MIKICKSCGKSFETEYESKLYCDKKCAKKMARNRDESFYDYPKESEIPLRSFECKFCGKRVDVYSRYDQRISFCCYKHSILYRNAEAKKRFSKGKKGSNIGMSSGMSLGSLIRREKRSLE